MTIRHDFLNRVEDVQRADDVVILGKHRVFAVDHRGRGRALFSEMHHRIRQKVMQRMAERIEIRSVAMIHLDRFAGQLLPAFDTLVQCLNGNKAVKAVLQVEMPPRLVIEYRNLITLLRQVKGLGPSEIAIAAQHEYTHDLCSPGEFVSYVI